MASKRMETSFDIYRYKIIPFLISMVTTLAQTVRLCSANISVPVSPDINSFVSESNIDVCVCKICNP